MQKGHQAIDLLIYTSLTVCTVCRCNFIRTMQKTKPLI